MRITSLDTQGDMEIGWQELDEEMEIMSIQRGQSNKVIKTRSKVEAEVNEKLVNFLRKYADVFAWSHDGMPGIKPAITCHRLAIRKKARSVRQKRRCFN